MSQYREIPLQANHTYHIYNQGNNAENLFFEERNYFYFLNKYQKYISPICHTYAYCLMPNHFHLLVQFKKYDELYQAMPKRFPKSIGDSVSDSEEIVIYDTLISKLISEQFRFFFGAYSKAINKAYGRKGKLFSLPFKRVLVQEEGYLKRLTVYIHRNPVHHEFCLDFKDWEFTSYNEYVKGEKVISNVELGFSFFDSKKEFMDYHIAAKQEFIDKSIYLE